MGPAPFPHNSEVPAALRARGKADVPQAPARRTTGISLLQGERCHYRVPKPKQGPTQNVC